MYDAFSPRVNGKPRPNWLSVRNIKAHAAIQKPVGGAYSLSVLTTYEPIVDELVQKFVNRLDEASRAGTGVCDMATWMRLCMSIDRIHGGDFLTPQMLLTLSCTLPLAIHLGFWTRGPT